MCHRPVVFYQAVQMKDQGSKMIQRQGVDPRSLVLSIEYIEKIFKKILLPNHSARRMLEI